MNRLTTEQIDAIHVALKKTGFYYVDILHEMTDHIATELEGEEGDFDRNLRLYIGRNKKELRSFNRKNIFIAWAQSWKGLLLNMLTIRFAALFAVVFLVLKGLNSVAGREDFVTIMFFVFCFANGAVSFPEVYRMIKKKDQYSVGEGIALLNVFVFFPGLFSIRYMNDVTSDTMVLLYFTVLLCLCALMGVTVRRFKADYKLRYNG